MHAHTYNARSAPVYLELIFIVTAGHIADLPID